ncbi:hypothetical protein F5051DRAFT_428130 [Lentinula edodes]|nr:hypothetical protein F5051DRAFT_428130 [Lentinula edodes]
MILPLAHNSDNISENTKNAINHIGGRIGNRTGRVPVVHESDSEESDTLQTSNIGAQKSVEAKENQELNIESGDEDTANIKMGNKRNDDHSAGLHRGDACAFPVFLFHDVVVVFLLLLCVVAYIKYSLNPLGKIFDFLFEALVCTVAFWEKSESLSSKFICVPLSKIPTPLDSVTLAHVKENHCLHQVVMKQQLKLEAER